MEEAEGSCCLGRPYVADKKREEREKYFDLFEPVKASYQNIRSALLFYNVSGGEFFAYFLSAQKVRERF